MNEQSKKERFEERRKDFGDCTIRLREALEQPYNSYIRDSVIKRYECCQETGWKMLKLWLEYEGIITMTPREVWKEAFSVGVLEGDADLWSYAQKIRNLTIHTYDEVLAEEVYKFSRDNAINLFEALSKKSKQWTVS